MTYYNVNLIKMLCMDCADYLQHEYPFVAWGVQHSSDYSMIEIRADIPGINDAYGWQIRTQDIDHLTMRNKRLRMFGGEILERFGHARDKATDLRDVKLKRNTRGQVQPEL